MSIWLKDPDDVCSFQFVWASFLSPGETITSAAVTTDNNLTAVGSGFTATTANIEVTGGVAGSQSLVTCVIETSAGNTYQTERTVYIQTRVS